GLGLHAKRLVVEGQEFGAGGEGVVQGRDAGLQALEGGGVGGGLAPGGEGGAILLGAQWRAQAGVPPGGGLVGRAAKVGGGVHGRPPIAFKRWALARAMWSST